MTQLSWIQYSSDFFFYQVINLGKGHLLENLHNQCMRYKEAKDKETESKEVQRTFKIPLNDLIIQIDPMFESSNVLQTVQVF